MDSYTRNSLGKLCSSLCSLGASQRKYTFTGKVVRGERRVGEKGIERLSNRIWTDSVFSNHANIIEANTSIRTLKEASWLCD